MGKITDVTLSSASPEFIEGSKGPLSCLDKLSMTGFFSYRDLSRYKHFYYSL